MIPFIAVMILLLGGLVIDGSRVLNARGEALAYAEEAARAGANAVDETSLDLTIKDSDAQAKVDSYCGVASGNDAVTRCTYDGLTEVGGIDRRVIVVNTTVNLKIRPTLLGMVGVGSFTASASAKARPYEGVSANDAG